MNIVSEIIIRNFVQYIICKSKIQKCLCIIFIDAARAQVEKCVIVHLPGCRSMSAFYIISKNFQLRLGVYDGIISQQNVFIGLVCVGFLRIFFHQDFTVKNSMRFSAKYSFIKLVAVAMWLRMINSRMVIQQLRTSCNV